MARDFLGTGWQAPVVTDHQGDIELSSGEDNIEENVELILGTAQGERVMRPEFGCAIHDYVFSAIDLTTLNLIEDAVREALIRWEPRVDVEDIDARPDESRPNRVLIDIQYRIRSTNSTANMVYPFYLEEGEE